DRHDPPRSSDSRIDDHGENRSVRPPSRHGANVECRFPDVEPRNLVRAVDDWRVGARRDHALHGPDVRIARPEVGDQPDASHRVHYTSPVFATLPPPAQRLLVFARLPELGKVKTRLAESIGDEKALDRKSTR